MKNRRLLRSNHKGRRMTPRKPKFVAEVTVTAGPIRDTGEVIGTAKIEKMSGGVFIAHIDASNMSAEMLRRGFTLGEFKEV
jgi:hypothetical protein